MLRCRLVLLICIVSLRAVAMDDEWMVREHFQDFSLLADYQVDASEVQSQLTSLASELRDTLGVRSNGEPIQIVLFESRKNYLAYLGSSVPTSRDRRAVFIRKGKLTSIYCYRSDVTTTDLRHEMTHALLHQHLQFLPLWLDEGLAEYFEEESRKRPSSSRTKSVRWKAALGKAPDLDRLERIEVAGDMNSTDYSDSWALCSFLINESSEFRTCLRDYLQHIHSGHAPPRFSEYIQTVGTDWQVRSNDYFRKPIFKTTSQLSEVE